MKETTKKNILKAIPMVIALIIICLMVKPATEKFSTNQKGYTCYEKICTKSTIEGFNSCKDLGLESTGFLSSQHFYLCDGNKIPYNCLEYGNVKTNRSIITFGIECRKESKEVSK